MTTLAGVQSVVADQCMYGLKVQGQKHGEHLPARKTTRFLTHSWHISQRLQKRCDGKHSHQTILGGNRSRESQVYPPGLCRTICEGLMKERATRRGNTVPLMRFTRIDNAARHAAKANNVDHVDDTFADCPDLPISGEAGARSIGKSEQTIKVLQGHGKCLEAFDDVTGLRLDGAKVLEARKKEILFVREKGVWSKIKRSVAKAKGWRILKTRWIDINTGDDDNPALRSRFVGKEFNTGPMEGLFAGTPPLEALRALVGDAATLDTEESKVIEVDDVSRAFFEADMQKDVCIELPAEDLDDKELNEDLVGYLHKSLYGTRDAATNSQEEIARLLVSNGFIRGKYNPCLYHHPGKQLKTLVHGDDFVTVGRRSVVKDFDKLLNSRSSIKTVVVGDGSDAGEAQESRILNRLIRWTPEGLEMEADQRHAEMIIESLGLTGARGVSTPGMPQAAGKTEEEEANLDEELPAAESTLFRSIGARANYLARDRVDIMFSVKEICRHMARPTQRAWLALKRLGRYLIHRPRAVMKYYWQGHESEIVGYSDSDWVGCNATGKRRPEEVSYGAHTF